MAAGDLTTIDRVKAFADVRNDASDALLTDLVTGASAYVKQWLARSLHQAVYTMWFDGTGGDVMFLPEWPVVSVSTVSIDERVIQPASGPKETGYRWDKYSVWLNNDRWSRGRGNCLIGWTAGYTDQTMPRDIVEAVTELVALVYRDRDRLGLVSKSMSGETTSYMQSAMTRRIESMLRPHRKVMPC
jgi:hypothetical protein